MGFQSHFINHYASGKNIIHTKPKNFIREVKNEKAVNRRCKPKK